MVDYLEDRLKDGGKIVDFHAVGLFPERWFDLIVVLRYVLFRIRERQQSCVSLRVNAFVSRSTLNIKLMLSVKGSMGIRFCLFKQVAGHLNLSVATFMH